MSPGAATLDAVVVGSGPNGLAAALTLARAGYSVEVFEAADTLGGGCRTAELTLPGFRHDVCSTIQSMVPCSPFFRDQVESLAERGVRLLTPEVAFGHALDGARAVTVTRSVAETAKGLGRDARAYERLMAPLVDDAPALVSSVLAPLRTPPRNPLTMARFALAGLGSASRLAKRFDTDEARALLGGVCAHAMLPLEDTLTAAFGLFLTVTAHDGGWPVVEGGSDRLIDAMAGELVELGATLHVARPVRALSDLPAARVTLFDTSPQSLVEIAGDKVNPRYRSQVARFRRGPGVFKVDWALSGPVPWAARELTRAATVHLGGSFAEVAQAESDVALGRHAERPYCIVVQAGVIDATRAPSGQHTLVVVLPRAQRLDDGHDLTDRGPDRALRPGLQGPGARARDDQRRPGRGAQRQLPRRGHRRRRGHAAPDAVSPRREMEPVSHGHARAVPLLGVDAPGRRCARDVRGVRRPHGHGGPQTPAVTSPVRGRRPPGACGSGVARVEVGS